MASAYGGKVGNFRDVFKVVDKRLLTWFPGHMEKGMKQMEKNLKNVDCLIEVHDARIPVSGRYADFRKTLCGLKPHVLVLNKIDLADETYMVPALDRINKEGITTVFQTNLKSESCRESKQILPTVTQLISQSNRYNRSEEKDFCVMVIGVPNTGKSTLINRLRSTHMRKSKATPVGNVAGVTRSVMTRIKISEDPLVYLLDTPGILPPFIKDVYCGLKLAVLGCSQDHVIGIQMLADYLLFWLNNNHRFEYVQKLKLLGPTDDVMELLIQIAVKANKIKKLKIDGQYVHRPDFHFAAEFFLRAFRSGELGLYCLDKDELENK